MLKPNNHYKVSAENDVIYIRGTNGNEYAYHVDPRQSKIMQMITLAKQMVYLEKNFQNVTFDLKKVSHLELVIRATMSTQRLLENNLGESEYRGKQELVRTIQAAETVKRFDNHTSLV